MKLKELLYCTKVFAKHVEEACKEIKDPLAQQIFMNAANFGLSAGLVTAVIEIQRGIEKKHEQRSD